MLLAWRDFLNKPLTVLKGLGEEKARLFAEELRVRTLGDLLYLLPLRYVDKTQIVPIAELEPLEGTDVFVRGKVISMARMGAGSKRRIIARLADQTGQMQLIWFRGGYYAERSVKVGNTYSVFGKVKKFGRQFSIAHPEMGEQSSASETFEPIYPSTEKFSAKGPSIRVRRKMVRAILRELEERFPGADDTLPVYLRDKYRLLTHAEALRNLHFPTDEAMAHQAARRFKYEELFLYHLRQQMAKVNHDRQVTGFKIAGPGPIYHRFVEDKLPFTLTRAQQRVLREVAEDMASGRHMNRLIQGDVGSGKTIVALLAMLMMIDHGYQTCLMAPTQILAQQHYEGLRELLRGTGVQIAFLSGSTRSAARRKLLAALAAGELHILVGTHALIEDQVVFDRLGMAVIDEQHRFGVKQRARLWRKSKEHPPHVLVMTATPIPRTLALTTYAELDVSKIDELPPGRKPVTTRHINRRNRPKIYEWIRSEIAKGRQVYIVYPLIEESAALDLKNATTGFEHIQEMYPPPQYEVVMIHGRLKPEEKDERMERFAQGKAQIMVATTVIEVGVNVPNASVMIIENAERFGLSQLHQLRGRVGRGAEQSYCLLMTEGSLSETGRERIKTMCATNDGFLIAEKDLELRGAGDIEGLKQSGQMPFHLAKLPDDQVIFDVAFEDARELLRRDPTLAEEQHEGLRHHNKVIGEVRRAWTQIS